MKKLIGLMALLRLYINSPAQNSKPLSVSDTIPGITLHHIINYKTDSVRLADLKKPVTRISFFVL